MSYQRSVCVLLEMAVGWKLLLYQVEFLMQSKYKSCMKKKQISVISFVTSFALCTASAKAGTFPSAPDGAPEAEKLLILHPEDRRTICTRNNPQL